MSKVKFLAAFLTILFIIFAYVQINDPDPWLWVAIYLYVALMSGFAFFEKTSKIALQIGIIACGGLFLSLLPDLVSWLFNGMPSIVESMKAEAPHIELTREALGAVLCLLTLGYLYPRKG